MVLKWWSVGLIVVLGLVWFVLAEQSTSAASRPLSARAPAGAAAPAMAPAAPVVLRSTQAGAPAGAVAMAQQAAEPAPASPAPAPTTGAAAPNAGQTPATTGPGAPTGGALASNRSPGAGLTGDAAALATKAAELSVAGDRAGAETALRQAVQKAGTAAEAARAGLLLAPFATDPLERRHLLSAALLENVVEGAEFDDVGSQLRELNRAPANSLQPALGLQEYVVAPNDSLWKLCNKVFPARFQQTPEVGLIRLLNGLKSDNLKVGQVLKVPTAPLQIHVSMQHHGLTAFVGETAVMAYWIGLGKESRTPRDTFVIQVKQEDPAWFNGQRTIPFGDPDNVLGTRWLGFEGKPGATGFGIHGTPYPESIGKDESMGCVRMRNAEVEELFEFVPRGTRVTIG